MTATRLRRRLGAARTMLTAGALVLLATAADARRNLAESLPADTHAAVWVTNLDEARASFSRNPFVQFLTDETYGLPEDLRALQGTLLRMPGSSTGPLESVWNALMAFTEKAMLDGIAHTRLVFPIESDGLLETFSGSVVIYSTMYKCFYDNNTPITEWDLVFAAEYAEPNRPAVERFLQHCLSAVPPNSKRSSDRYLGEEIFHIEYFVEEQAGLGGGSGDGLGLLEEIPILIEYAWVDGVFLLSEGREQPLKKAIRALKEGGAATLGSTRAWQETQALATLDAAPLGAWYDLRRHASEWRNVRDRTDDYRRLEGAGLHRSGPLLAQARVDENGARVEAVLRRDDGSDGLWKILAAAPDNNLESMRAIPREVLNFASLSVDFREVFDQFVAWLELVTPGAGSMVHGGLGFMQQRFGVDLRSDVITHARGELSSYVRPGAPGQPVPEGALMIPFARGGAPADALNNLLEKLAAEDPQLVPISKAEEGGIAFWSIGEESAGPGGTFHVSVMPEGFLLATSGSELRGAVRAVREGVGSSIMESDRVRGIARGIAGEGLVAFSMTPLEGILKTYDLVRMQQSGGGRPSFAGALLGLSGEVPSESELRRVYGDAWWAVHRAEGGLRFDYTIESPEAP